MRSLFGLGLVMLVVLTLPASARAADAPVPTCNPAPADCAGWYRTNVTVTWAYTGAPSECEFTTIVVDTAGRDVSCSSTVGSITQKTTVSIKRDSAPPQITGATPSRGPDSAGWYNRPLSVAFSGSDGLSGIASCSNPTYGAVDGAAAGVTGTCTDVAGNTSASGSYALKYDATPPSVSPSVERPPDGKGWYRKPVTVSFAGTDLTSGIAACTAPTRYAGPDQAKAAVVGTCRDAAGNSADAGHTFQYDATAPTLTKTEAKFNRGVARIGWARAGDVVDVKLVRSPGINGAKSTTVYQGNGAAFVDKTVKAGVRYRYEISVADLAGNVTTKAVTAASTAAKKSTSLLAPAAGAVVKAPPLLRWKVVKGATFYNVQLYRNGRKLLSSWPGVARLRLARTWTYAGKRQRLTPGVYTWYVWGARGTRAKPVFGSVLGSSKFTVKR